MIPRDASNNSQINMGGGGTLTLRDNSNATKFTFTSGGNVTATGLAGTGIRTLIADANGQLVAVANPAAGQVLTSGSTPAPTWTSGGSGTNAQALTYNGGTPAWTLVLTNPMTAIGDLIVGGASGAATVLPEGTAGKLLVANAAGTAPSWQLLGQSCASVVQTAACTIGNGSTATDTADWITLPGLSSTVNVPSGYVLYLSTDGGISTTSASATSGSIIEMGVFVDVAETLAVATHPTAGLWRRLTAANNAYTIVTAANGGVSAPGATALWTMSGVLSLSAGAHKVTVKATWPGGRGASGVGAAANVGSGAGSSRQGVLTVCLLKL